MDEATPRKTGGNLFFLPQKKTFKHLALCLQFIISFSIASIIKILVTEWWVSLGGLSTWKYQDKTK